MKKNIFSILSLGLLSSQLFAIEPTLSDLNYVWIPKEKKCEKTTIQEKSYILKEIERGNLILDKKFEKDNETILSFVGESSDNTEYTITTMSSFGRCRFYEDLIIKKLPVDSNNYINLVDPNLKKK